MALRGSELTVGLPKDVQEARDRFKLCKDWESTSRQLWIDDVKFANADPDNGWQWDDALQAERDLEDRPCLTINMVKQHNFQIINDGKQNKPGIKIRATGGGASYESAQMYSSLIRYIERCSNASVAYSIASEFQVTGGFGAWRVVTEYVDDSTHDQDAKILPLYDPMSVYIDPDARERDKSDMRYAFLWEDMPNDQLRSKHPEWADQIGVMNVVGQGDEWLNQQTTRVCEYFRKVVKEHTLFAVKMQDGSFTFIRDDKLPSNLKKEILRAEGTKERPVYETKVERLTIVGNKVVERNDWPGKYIPIVPVIGEELIIEGKLERKGHTRSLKDTQRMYNWMSSSAVEYGALQTKTPYLAAIESIGSYQDEWKKLNLENLPFLPWQAYSEDGQEKPNPEPKRIEPPVPLPMAITGMQIAQSEMMRASGQYEAQLGLQGNERSGKAINERQRQGDNSTYHYIDNLAIAIRHTGRILLDLIPRIYDTRRIIMAQAEDGQYFELLLDPQQQQAFQKKQEYNQSVAQRILNPTVGKYEVEADVGPGYATKREEAFNAYTLLLTQAPDLAKVIGDLLFKAADFAEADEAAARLRRMIPPEVLGEGPSAAEAQLKDENEKLKVLLTRALEEIAKAQIEAKASRADNKTDVYNAITQRLKVMLDNAVAGTDQRIEMAKVASDVIADAQSHEAAMAQVEATKQAKKAVGGSE